MRNNIFVEGYIEYLADVRKLKHTSAKDVRCTLNRLNEFLLENSIESSLWELEQSDFVNFFFHQRENGKSPTSISKFVSHLRSFLNYCWKVGKTNKNVLEGYSIHDSKIRIPPRVLTLEEVHLLISSLPQRTKIERERRLIILTLYGLGVRTSELCRMNIKDIDLDKRDAYVFKGKRDINRYIPIPDGLYVELAIHIKGQRRKSGPLFLTHHKKKRLNVAYVGTVVKEASARCKLEDVTPKTLRHSFATHLIDSGIAIEIIASLMGHKTPKETGVYLHSFEAQRKKSVDDLEKILTKEDE